MIFMLSSSGYVMYKTSCSCTGKEQTSVFVKPDTCEDNFHEHHKHDSHENEIVCSAHECHECTSHTEACGCDSPEVFFFKLKDQAVDEEVKFVSLVTEIELFISSVDLLNNIIDTKTEIDVNTPYIDPPPKITSSLDFLIHIQQLKIPSLA